MIGVRSFLFLAAGAMTASAFAAPPRHAAHHHMVAVDWTRTVTATSDGGFRMGNPKAKVTLVEYSSFTCPHCAAFAGEAIPTIRDSFVRSGKLSFEVRPAVRDRADYVAALIARCAGPTRFFATAEAIFAAQGDWETRAIDYDSNHPAALSGKDEIAAIGGLASGAGLDTIAKAHGATPASLIRCYGDAGVKTVIQKTTDDAWGTRKIGGTPTFYINDIKQDSVYTWKDLEPKLRDAVKG
ncbi:MAG: protein-disulfide isomerase [Sphingomonas bacterium]|jgi:protein-disulfide isomerase|nr:protein-disulfide isomerase [Sphingomonas bacterium]